MNTPFKNVSPAELSALEHAFASDPSSDAYRPLTEAYLAAGRFMEAMVVCKKGVKAHPDDPAPKVLLARVYAAQGKDRKALDELSGVLAAFPSFAAASLLAGELHLRLGERGPGEAALLRAADAAPDDPAVAAALERHGIGAAAAPVVSPAGAPPPAPPAAGASAPAAGPAAAPPARPAAPGPAAPAPHAAAPAADPRPSAAGADAVPPPAAPQPARSPAPPATPPAAPRPQGAAYADHLAEKYGTQAFQLPESGERASSKRGTLLATVGLFLVLAVALGGWSAFNRARKERIETIDRLIKDTLPLLDRDAHAAYVEASRNAALILEQDGHSLAGNAFGAYAAALRFAEHGEGDAVRDEAVARVDAGRRIGRHSHLVAAEAYLKLHAGDPQGARDAIDAVLGGADPGQSPFLGAVLGAVHLRTGDLDAARDVLGRAQKANPGDARTAWLLAEQFRRRGEGYELQASGLYDYALRIQKDHLPSILGKALVLLARGQVDEAGRAAAGVLAPQAAASRPQLALAHAIRGSVLAAQGKAAEGAAAEAEAVKLDPTNPDLPWLVGQRRLRAGDAAGAVEAFQRAVALDPRRVSLYADLVRALLAKPGGAPQAIETLKKAVTRLGESPRLALLLGDAYRAVGDMDLARGQYEKAIALGRPFPDARVALARLHRDRNNIPGALVELTQAIDEYGQGGAGGAALAYVEMAEAERARGARRDVLLGLYGKALERDPASCEALWGAGRLGFDAEKLSDTVRERLELYTRLCPGGARVAEARGLLGGR